MKILIIGGTKFLGRHLINSALKNSHEITLFNRGKHSPENFENVEQIRGDRNKDLGKLSGRKWDVCIDTCGYLPQTVKASAEQLKDSVEQYVFISSISAYADYTQIDFDETAPLAELTEEQKIKAAKIDSRGEINAAALEDMYGALKALSEREAQKVFADKTLILRSGLIVGSFDTTDRFTYWVMRVAGGGEVLAPGVPRRFVQLIDVRDLTEWIIKMIENRQSGIYNVAGKPFALTMENMLEEIKSASGSDAAFTWVNEEFLKREKVEEWSEMPLYLGESVEEARGFLSVNIDKALGENLNFRSLTDTIQNTFDWRKTKNDALKAGIDADRERQLLQKWREQQ